MISFEKKLEKTRDIFNKYKGYIPEDIYKESQKRINEAEISNKNNGNGGELLLKLSDYISEGIKKDSSNEFKKFSVFFSKEIRGVSDFESQGNIVKKMKDLNLGGFSDGICAGLVLLHDLNIRFDDGESINKKVSKVFGTKNVSLQKTLSDLLCSAQVKALTRQLTKADLLTYFPEGLKEDFITTFNRFLVETVVEKLMDKEFTKSKKTSLAISFENPKSGEHFVHAVSLQWVVESGWIYYDPNHGECTFSTKEALLGFIESSYRNFNVSLIGALLSGTSSNLYGKEFLAEIESDFNKIKGEINEAAKDFDNSLGEDGEVIEWEKPSREVFDRILQEFIKDKKTTKYDKNLIIQLQSEETVNDSVLNLLGKHPEQSALLQLDPDNNSLNVLLWDNETKDFRISSIADWLTLDSEGMIRIQLVGHGVTKEGKTTLGGLDVAQLQQAIHPVLELLTKSGPQLKGLKLSLVGCETLPAGGSLEQSLPAQLLQFIHNQLQQLELKDIPLQLTGRELQIQVNNDGHKLVNIDGKWVSKEVANLLGKQHKTTLLVQDGQVCIQAKSKEQLLALITEIQGLREPHSADEAALIKLIGEGIQDEIRDLTVENHDKQTVQLLRQLDELLKLKGQVNDILSQLQTHPELQNFKPTFEIDKAGKQLWLGPKGEKKYIVIKQEQHGKIVEFSERMKQLLDDYQQHISLDKNGNIILDGSGTFPALDKVEGGSATLNAAFLIQTLMGENPFNNGLDHVSTAMKIQAYVQLIQNSTGLIHDIKNVTELVLQATKSDFNLLGKVIGISNALGSIGGTLLDFVNIGASIAQVLQANDEGSQAQAISSLVVNLIPTGINVAAIVAGLVGASTAGAILGDIVVPVTGLAIGLQSLISIELEYTTRFDEAKNHFDKMLNDYNGMAKKGLSSIIGSSVVITGLNFKDGQLTLGQAKVGEYTLKNNIVDIYDGFGSVKSGGAVVNGAIRDGEGFLLPSNLSLIYFTQGQTMLGGSYSGCEAFEKLRARFGDKFQWIKERTFGADILNIMAVEYLDTSIKIDLDANLRQMVMPTITDDEHRVKLHYQLIGGGGATTLSMSHLPMDLTVTASGKAKESWTFDISRLVKDVTVENDIIKVGHCLLNNINSKIDIQSDYLKIGAQTIIFEGQQRPGNLYLLSDLAMTNSEGHPVISPFRADDQPLQGQLMMRVELLKQQVTQYVLSFESSDEAVASLCHLRHTLSPLVKTGMVTLTLKNSDSYGVFDLDNNRGAFLNEKTGIFSYFESGIVSELKVTRPSSQLLEQVLHGQEMAQIHYGKDGVFLQSTVFMKNLQEATLLARVKVLNGQASLQIESVSMKPRSFEFFVAYVLKQLNPLVQLAELLGKPDLQVGENVHIAIENLRGQQMVFRYDAGQQCMQLQSAVWMIAGAACSYSLLAGEAYLLVQGQERVTELVLRDEDIQLDYRAVNAALVVKVSGTTQRLFLPDSARVFKEIMVSGAGKELSLIMGEGQSDEYSLTWDGNDLLICTASPQHIRLTNAWGVNTLRLGFIDKIVHVDLLACWAKQSQLHDSIAELFSREKTYAEYEIGNVRYFSGESGVQYRLDGKIVSAIGYAGKGSLVLPEQGIRSLDMLDKILAGQTLFGERSIHGVNLNQFFPVTGQGAVDILAVLECDDEWNTKAVKGALLEQVTKLLGGSVMLDMWGAEQWVDEVFEVSKNMVKDGMIPTVSPCTLLPMSYERREASLDQLVMAMNCLVSSDERGLGREHVMQMGEVVAVNMALTH